MRDPRAVLAKLLVGIAVIVVVPACSGGGAPDAGSSGGDAASGGSGGSSGSAAGSGMVAQERIDACAGIDAQAAAGILGVPAAELTEFQGMDSGSPGMYSCGFRSRENPGTAVGFYLQPLSSVAEAVASMESDRENLRMAAGAIGAVTPDANEQAPIQPIEGLGDEAYWTPVNGTVNLRKANVLVQVVAPQDVEAKKRLAERIAAGLE